MSKPKRRYVLTFVRDDDSILLINKLRPSWQKGHLNLPGGKVEDNEPPIVAAARELYEETNLRAFYMKEVGWIDGGDDYHIYVFAAVSHHPFIARSKTDEQVEWMHYRDALRHERLIPNLRIMIPLLMAGVDRWLLVPRNNDPFSEEWEVSVLPQDDARCLLLSLC